MPRQVIILGAGVSGLSCAWSLKKKYGSSIQITILEKSSRVGGWIQTIRSNGFLFEQGPHSYRSKGTGYHTLQLIEELGLQDKVIEADSSARFRYLYLNQKLEKLPHNLMSFLTSPLTKGVIPALLSDFLRPKRAHSDESIYDYFARHLTPSLAETFVDPMISGIYAGDMRKLSLQACFPKLHNKEQEYGSLLRGLLFSSKDTPVTQLLLLGNG